MIYVAVVGVSLPFIVNRDLTLKRWPDSHCLRFTLEERL